MVCANFRGQFDSAMTRHFIDIRSQLLFHRNNIFRITMFAHLLCVLILYPCRELGFLITIGFVGLLISRRVEVGILAARNWQLENAHIRGYVDSATILQYFVFYFFNNFTPSSTFHLPTHLQFHQQIHFHNTPDGNRHLQFRYCQQFETLSANMLQTLVTTSTLLSTTIPYSLLLICRGTALTVNRS